MALLQKKTLAAVLLAVFAWARHSSPVRLALFFLVYAIGFGNHLTMIVLMPGLVVFLLASVPGGPRAMLTPLGERMYPLLKQCYDSAQAARALATWPGGSGVRRR